MADELHAEWDRTRESLEASRDRLPDPDGRGVDDVQDYLVHNELGLAFDVLVDVGRSQRAKRGFWDKVREAAAEMNLSVEDGVHGGSMRTLDEWLKRRDSYPCPCCSHLVFDEPPGSDEICPICFWQDDIVQLRWPDRAGGANRPSLIDAQVNFLKLGVSEERLAQHTRAPVEGEKPDPSWRPFDPGRDQVEEWRPGTEYGRTYESDTTRYYYWESQRT